MSRFSKPGRRKLDQAHRLREIELHGLIDTSRLIHSSIHDLNKLMSLIIRISAEILNAEGSSIVLRDKVEGGLVFKHAVTDEKARSKLTSFRLAEGEGIAGNCVRTQSAIIVNDVRSDRRFSGKADMKTGLATRSILCIPLIVENECIGALELVNKKEKKGFDKHDLLLGEAIASQIAVAIRNAQLEEEALKAEKLAAIGQAVTGVAHCVKNMLNALYGGLYVLRRCFEKARANVPETGLGMLERNLTKLNDLVNDMLTYSKERRPEYELSDLNEVARSVVELMEPKAKERKINLRFHPAPGLENVEIDPKGIYRCVLNLVSNALDACEAQDSCVDVRIRPPDSDQILIEVSDQGCGMDEDTLKSIFQAFFSTKGAKGTGLGLSVTQKIIEEHGGRIEADSKPGLGSSFRVYLPRYKPKLSASGPA